MRPLILAVAALMFGALPGCLGPEWADPQASFSVASARLQHDDCSGSDFAFGGGPDDPYCHHLTAKVTNEMEEEDLALEPSDWTAVRKDGVVLDAYSITGGDAIAPGYNATVTIRFEGDGPTRIDLLRFKDFFNERYTTSPAPAY